MQKTEVYLEKEILHRKSKKVKVAAAQISSVYIDKDATIEKIEKFAKEASNNSLLALGESAVPCFPVWNLVHIPVDQHKFYKLLYENAIEIGDEAYQRLSDIARKNKIYLSVGITEKSSKSPGTMWNTNLIFNPEGKLINRRRKLVPTWAEKLTWANGDSYGLEPVDTSFGKVGILICGENTNTLARFSLLAQGEQIHIATYPPAWPFDRPNNKNYDLLEAIKIRAAAHSFEGKIFTIVSSGILDDEAIKFISNGDEEVMNILQSSPQPVSAIFGPTGELVSEPLIGKEGIVSAEIDLSECIKWKQIHDITGGYNRFDIFKLKIIKRELKSIEIVEDL